MIANCASLREAATIITREAESDSNLVGSVAHHFLQWLGVVIGGWQWCMYAADDAQTAAFYAAHVLPRARVHEAIVRSGSAPLSGVPPLSI
jgi:hypothetical protein